MSTYADPKQQNAVNGNKMDRVLKDYKMEKENENNYNNNNNNNNKNNSSSNNSSNNNGKEIDNVWEIHRSDIVNPNTETFERPTADEQRQI